MPDLSLSLSEYRTELGWELGYGREPAGWDADQAETVRRLLTSAQRMVYYPALTGNRAESHKWSFLRRLDTVSLADGSHTADLPADYHSMEGEITLTTDGVVICPIELSAGTRVHRHRHPDTAGRPQMAEEEWHRPPGLSAGQRCRLHVWPTADDDYTLQFMMAINPVALADERPFNYGGPGLSELFKKACLAAVEFYVYREQKEAAAAFQAELAARISDDRRHQPKILGYVGDTSDSEHWPWDRTGFPRVLVNGQHPE